jgi:purine-binding chemotaxis protein CheW
MSRLVTFSVAGHVFGVPVHVVQEVLRTQRMTEVPLAPAAVAGLVNLRGQVVTAVDLRRRLGLPSRQEEQALAAATAGGATAGQPVTVAEPMAADSAMSVVVRTPVGPVSLLVDKVGDVMDVSDDALEPVPPTLDDVTRRLVLGAYQLPEALLLDLDVSTAVDTTIDIGVPPGFSAVPERWSAPERTDLQGSAKESPKAILAQAGSATDITA